MNAVPSEGTTSASAATVGTANPGGPAGRRGVSVEYGDGYDATWPDTAAGGLAAGLATGMPLGLLLRTTAEECGSGRLAASFRKLATDIERGVPLESALGTSEVPPMFAEILRLSGRGPLAEPLMRETLLQWNQQRELKRQLQETLWYLATLALVSTGLVIGVLVACVPQMREIFDGFGVELPVLTQLVLSVSGFILDAWPVLLVGVGVLVVGLWLALSASAPRRFLADLFATIPPFHLVIVKSAELQFLNTLAILVDGARPLPQAIEAAGEASGLRLVRVRAEQTAARIERGESPAEAFDVPGSWPAMFAIPFHWGKTPVEIADGLRMVAGLHRLRMSTASMTLVAWMEPLLMLGIGGMFGLVVIAMFMPLIKLLNDLS